MIHKLPSPRSDNSHFGYMNAALFDSIVGSFFKKYCP